MALPETSSIESRGNKTLPLEPVVNSYYIIVFFVTNNQEIGHMQIIECLLCSGLEQSTGIIQLDYFQLTKGHEIVGRVTSS